MAALERFAKRLILFVWGMAYADKRSAAPPIEAMGPPSDVRCGHTHALPESTFLQKFHSERELSVA